MGTAADLITRVLKKSGVIGIGNTARAEDANDALADLNGMLAQWSRKRWIVYHLMDTAFMANGSGVYTVGSGGNFNIAFPDRIEDAYVRLNPSLPSQVDYPLTVIQSREDWDRVAAKNITGFPNAVYYDAAYPLGNLFVYPVPTSGQYQIHILTKAPLTAIANLAATINLAPEYDEALLYNLAGRLRPGYGMSPDPTITALANASLATIRGENVEVPRMVMPLGLGGQNSQYNAYTDE